MSIKNLLTRLKSIKRLSLMNIAFVGIRAKLTAAFMIMVIPILITGYFSYTVFANSISGYALNSVFETTQQMANYLNLIFTSVEKESARILINEDLQKYLDLAEGRHTLQQNETIGIKDAARDLINDYALTSRYISNISILTEDRRFSFGTLNFKADRLDFGALFASDWYNEVSQKTGEIHWIGKRPELDPAFLAVGVYSASMARSINSSENGDTIGVLVIDIAGNVLYDLIKEVRMGAGSVVYLISPDGRHISSANTENIVGADSAASANQTDITLENFYIGLVNSSETEGSDIVNFNGGDHLMTYSKLGKTGYVLLALTPKVELLSDARRIAMVTFSIGGIAALFSVVIGVYLSKSMAGTIKNIMCITEAAAEGNLTMRSESHSRDELGKLSLAINATFDNLRQLICEASSVTIALTNASEAVTMTARQIKTSSDEVSSAMMEVAKASSEQACDTEKGVQTMGEFSEKIRQVSEKSISITELSDETAALAKKGISIVDNLQTKTDFTTEATEKIISEIRMLEEKSEAISKIASAIESIAAKTNLLALNAAIEAARAGQEGKGFAVVAQEVRALAEQSMLATREITKIIELVLKQTKNAAISAQTAEESLNYQFQAVRDTIMTFKDIAASMLTLSKNASVVRFEIESMEHQKKQVYAAMQNISAVSEQVAASAEEVASSVEEQVSGMEQLVTYANELNSSAMQMSTAINRFKLD